MIALDTDVLSIYYIFHGDARYEATARFIEESEQLPRGVGIFNLLELCGIAASGGQPAEALRLFEEYQGADVRILYPPIVVESQEGFWADQNAQLLERIQRGMRLGDAVGPVGG